MFKFNCRTYTMDQLERNHEAALDLLNKIRWAYQNNRSGVEWELVVAAEENEQKHWFRLEKARDWATD